MTKAASYLFSLAISSLLIGCNSTTENRNQTTDASNIPSATIDTVSAIEPNSMPINKTGAAEKSQAKAQPDATEFHKVLNFKNIAFTVKTSGKGSLQQVTVQPSGLTATNRAETMETEPVIGAEIGDLNADGYPELLIFTQSAGSGSYGNVVAFSVNNGKSMSQVSFPETGQNPQVKKGYGGHDKFTLVNNTLMQEFPLYNAGDVNTKPTGMKRQITYKLKNGENSRFFEVDEVKEISVK